MNIAIVLALVIVPLGAGCASDEGDDRPDSVRSETIETPVPRATDILATHRTAQAWQPVIPASPGEGGYRFAIVQGAFADRASALRAQDPTVRTLVYKNVTQVVESDVPLDDDVRSTGVDYVATLREHPEWLLRDTSGDRITRDYDADETDYLMDVGNPAYQRAWAHAVARQAIRDGWDGVFLDDALPTLKYWLPSGRVSEVAAYPSDSAWQAATRSFLEAVGTRLRAAGLVVVANVCCDLTYRTRADWVQFLDGSMDEGFLNPQADAESELVHLSENDSADWRGYVRELAEAEAAGKFFLATTIGPSGDERRARYALGTFLLGAGGRASFEYHASDREPTRYEALATASGLGTPLGSFEEKANELFVREFAHGVVIVNPNEPSSPPLAIDLGQRRAGAASVDVTGVEIAPLDAAILVDH